MSTIATVPVRHRSIAAAMLAFAALSVHAQGYPARPVRMVVGFPPGGGTDAVARVLAQKLSGELGQSVIVENRPGADSAIANERVARSNPDGHTLLMLTASSTIHPFLRTTVPYSVEKDLDPVSLVVIGPYVLVVNPALQATSVQELISLARAQPGKLKSGFTGVGSTTHLSDALFHLLAKIEVSHVPYKGGAEAAVATASGQVEMNFASITSVLPLIESGRVRPIAVTSLKRSTLLPQVPTAAESGLPDYEYSTWYGLVAPAGTPSPIVSRLNELTGRALGLTDVKASVDRLGFYPQASTAAEFRAFIAKELAKHGKLTKAIGLKPE